MSGTTRSVTLLRLLLVCLTLGFALAPSASADTTYTYQGNPFTTYEISYTCGGPCIKYLPNSSISGSFTLAAALSPNFDGSVTPLAFAFTDGANCVFFNSGGVCPPTGMGGRYGPLFSTFLLATDAEGSITWWDVFIGFYNQDSYLQTIGPYGGTVVDRSVYIYAGNGFPLGDAYVQSQPGTWQVTGPPPPPTPEPPTLILLGSGLLTMAGTVLLRRHRPQGSRP